MMDISDAMLARLLSQPDVVAAEIRDQHTRTRGARDDAAAGWRDLVTALAAEVSALRTQNINREATTHRDMQTRAPWRTR